MSAHDEKTAVTLGQLKRVLEPVMEAIAVRVREMDARIKELEAKPQLKYQGVWERERQYDEGSFVTDAGSMWHANRTTKSRPGESDDWTLCVKRGRSGR